MFRRSLMVSTLCLLLAGIDATAGRAKAPAPANATATAVAPPKLTTRTVRGKIYEKGKRDEVRFLITEVDSYEDGKLVGVRRVYTDPNGAETVIEEGTLDGVKVKTYSVDQKQLGDKGQLEVGEKRITLAYGKTGKLETDDESTPDNLVTSVNMMPYLEQQKDKLLAGKEVHIRFVVLDRKETIGFDFEKVEDTKINGKDVIILKMSASNFLIAAIVDPLRFVVEKDSFRLLEMTGRAMPSRKDGDKWTTFDADHVYFYD